MNTETLIERSVNQFQFKDIANGTELASKSNLKLIQLLAYAPPGAVATGIVQKSAKGFSASLTIWSPYRIFTASSVALSAEVAVDRVLRKIDDQLFDWRFGSGNGRSSPQASIGHMRPSSFAKGR